MQSNTDTQVVAVIPARGGSKGIPGKNIRLLAGKPLLAWTVEAAVAANSIDSVYVSTDDPAIAKVAEACGAEVIFRPADISGDESPSETALLHALGYLNKQGMVVEIMVFLQATSPLRTSADIDCAMALFQEQQADSLLSVAPSHYFLWEETKEGAQPVNYDYCHRPRRQDMIQQFRENGAIYIFKPSILREYSSRLGGRIILYKMLEESSLDIDSYSDFERAGAYLRGRKN